MSNHDTSTLALALRMAAPLVIGIPLVYVLWEFINDLLSAQATLSQTLIALPVLIVFLIFLRFLGRAIERFTGAE